MKYSLLFLLTHLCSIFHVSYGTPKNPNANSRDIFFGFRPSSTQTASVAATAAGVAAASTSSSSRDVVRGGSSAIKNKKIPSSTANKNVQITELVYTDISNIQMKPESSSSSSSSSFPSFFSRQASAVASSSSTSPSHTTRSRSTAAAASVVTPTTSINTSSQTASKIHINQNAITTVPTSTTDDDYSKAMIRTGITVSAACLFGIGLMILKGPNTAYEFFAGYLIEQSLSIDNLFVFIMLFEYFKIPSHLQGRVLSWGITGAIVLRGLMIGLGVAAIQKFQSVILVFAGILIASSINLLLETRHQDYHPEDENDMDNNPIMKITKYFFPNISMDLNHGEAFFVQDVTTGKRLVTPLFLCLICVELSDFVFAVDSIPAVLGVSKDPLVVYASNIFAIMALRSLYTVINKAVSNFKYLKPAVAVVLGFVGCKMIAEYFHIEISTMMSLSVIVSVLASGVMASLIHQEKEEQETKRKEEARLLSLPSPSLRL